MGHLFHTVRLCVAYAQSMDIPSDLPCVLSLIALNLGLSQQPASMVILFPQHPNTQHWGFTHRGPCLNFFMGVRIQT